MSAPRVSSGTRKPEFYVLMSGSARTDFLGVKRILGSRIQIVDVWDLVHNLTLDYKRSEVGINARLRLVEAARCVLFHPSSWEMLAYEPVNSDSTHSFVRRQLAAVEHYVEQRLERLAATVNKPSTSRLMSNKLIQLDRISRRLPNHLLRTQVRSSRPPFPRATIIKHVSESRVISSRLSSYAHFVDRAAERTLSMTVALPVIAQRRVEAELEYRAYMFGTSDVTLAFQRKQLSGALVDIHQSSAVLNRPEETRLPKRILRSLHTILRTLELSYGAIDFFLCEGRVVLLEVNPLPSWAWLPSVLRERIDEAMAAFVSSWPAAAS
jgi:glutathione synthase/RimK-type ligase-like ATP-grasp enzyme